MPDNRKLSRRITGKSQDRSQSARGHWVEWRIVAEIELASEGQVPIPKRSGGSTVPVDPTQDLEPSIPPSAPSHLPPDLGAATLLHGHVIREDDLPAEASSNEKAKQPTLKRSKALSRPLADITKMVNLAALASESDQGKYGKSRFTANSGSARGPTKKLGVYRDLPTDLGSTPIASLIARRTATGLAQDLNHRMALDDSAMTEDDLTGGGDQASAETDLQFVLLCRVLKLLLHLAQSAGSVIAKRQEEKGLRCCHRTPQEEHCHAQQKMKMLL